jgi:hypothetical protein
MKTFFLALFFPLLSFGITLEENDFLGSIDVFHDEEHHIEGRLTVSKNPHAGPYDMQLMMKIDLKVDHWDIKRVCKAHYTPRFNTLDADCYKQAGYPDFQIQIRVAPKDMIKFVEHKWSAAQFRVFQARHTSRGFRHQVQAEVRKK